jgi:hypothetical protein
MIRELAAAPLAPRPPRGVDEPQVAYEPIVSPPPVLSRWGQPIWPAEEPITILERPSVAQLDIITMSVILAYRPE